MSPAKKSDLPAAAGGPLTLTEEWEQVRFEALQESLQSAFEAAQEQLDETPVGFLAPTADGDPEAAVVEHDAPVENNILLNVGQLESADSDDSALADVDDASNQSEVDADKDSDRKPNICNSADANQYASVQPAAKVASPASGSNASRNVIRNPVPVDSRPQLVPNAVLKDNGQRIHAAMNPNSQPRSQYYRDHVYSASTPSSVSGQSASPTPPPVTPTDGAPVPAPHVAMHSDGQRRSGSSHYRGDKDVRRPWASIPDAPTPPTVSGPSASLTPPPVTPTDDAPVPAPPIPASNNQGVLGPADLNRARAEYRAQGTVTFVVDDPETARARQAAKELAAQAAAAAKKSSGKGKGKAATQAGNENLYAQDGFADKKEGSKAAKKNSGKGKGKAATQAAADLSNKRRRPFEDEDQEEGPAKRQRGQTLSDQ